MDNTGLLKSFGVRSSGHWMPAYVCVCTWRACLLDQVLLEILNQLLQLALHPFPWVLHYTGRYRVTYLPKFKMQQYSRNRHSPPT